MKSFTYNDFEYSVELATNGWDIVCQRGGGSSGFIGSGLFAGASECEALERARALVRLINPVGIKVVGPDVTHPNMIGDLKIVGPDVTHPNFIYWDKDSSSCPKEL